LLKRHPAGFFRRTDGLSAWPTPNQTSGGGSDYRWSISADSGATAAVTGGQWPVGERIDAAAAPRNKWRRALFYGFRRVTVAVGGFLGIAERLLDADP